MRGRRLPLGPSVGAAREHPVSYVLELAALDG